MSNRQGMFLGDGSGEYDTLATLATLHQLAATDSEEEGEEADYALVDTSSGDDSYHSDNDEIAEYWDPYLYQLQLQAPTPHCVPCTTEVPDRPSFYGEEFHGSISREETSRLLGVKDGNYLVRSGLSHAGSYSLSFVFGGQVRHYRLYYEQREKCHYVGEKPFDTIRDLVQDGLITLFMEANNVEEYLQSARTRTRRLTISSSSSHSIPSRPTIRDRPMATAVQEPLFEEKEYTPSPPPPEAPSTHHQPAHCPSILQQNRERSNSASPGPAHDHTHRMRPRRTYDEVEDVPPPDDLAPLPNGISFGKTTFKLHKENSLYFHYDKPHNFKLHNYIGLQWCDYCRNFMWGLRNQGYRCRDCGYNAHKQCKDDTSSDCQPSRQLVKRVFGVELTTLVKMHMTKVPVVVKECIEELERRGLAMEGLYRVSGMTSEVLHIKKEFDRDSCADLVACIDVHTITGALKLYLRELPVPLMTFEAYDLALIAAGSRSQAESLDMMKVALARLPPAHYNTLRHLLRHLYKVQMLKASNKMDAKNLSVVFAPTIMRSPYTTGVMAVQKLPQQRKAVEMLITKCHELFQY